MSRRYDQSTTTFSPEGRIQQVENAIEAINNAGTAVGILVQDGIILAGELKSSSKLIAPSKSNEKIYVVDNHISFLVAGLSSDANILINQARILAQQHRYRYREPIPVEVLIQRICNYKQSYTQFGGLRPFGVSFLVAGWDVHFGYQLYFSDPSGNYSAWKATCIGQNNPNGRSLLKTHYSDTLSVSEALNLSVRVLLKTMDSATPSVEGMEITVFQHTGESANRPTIGLDARDLVSPSNACRLVTLNLDEKRVLLDRVKVMLKSETDDDSAMTEEKTADEEVDHYE